MAGQDALLDVRLGGIHGGVFICQTTNCLINIELANLINYEHGPDIW